MRAVEFFESTGREIKKWFANQGVKVKVRNIRGKYISVASVEGDMPNEFRKMVIDKVPFFQGANITDIDNIDYGNIRARYIAISPDQWDIVMAPEASRQLGDTSREVMVVKDGKVIVIDAEDEAEYLENGWTLAESVKKDGMEEIISKPGSPVNEATEWKMGDGRPRGASHIENIRFWDLPYDQLKFIIKDAGEAMKANPTGRKAISGPGNYADQVNDATTVLYWRKKNGIGEVKPLRWHLTHEYHVKYAKSKNDPIKITKFATHDQAKEFLADVEKDGMKGIISWRGRPVKEEVELDEISRKTLGSYISKASDARGHRKLSTKKVDNRYAGVSKASKKLILRSEYEVKYAKSKSSPIKVAKFMTLDQAKEFLDDVKKDGMNGIISKGGKPVKEEIELNEMAWKVGVVYHQEFENGDRVYFRADSVQKNKRWKGLSVDEVGGRQKKAKNSTADENLSFWKITPKNEIPKALKEDEGLDEGWPSGRIEDPMNNAAKLKIFDKLKKGGTVKIKFDFGSLRDLGGHFKVLDRKLVGKGQRYEEEQITMTDVGSKKVGGYALHNRGGNVRFVVGEYPASIVDMKEEVGLDEVTPSVVKKAGRRSAGSWGRPGSKKQKRAASKSSRQWNLNDLDHGDDGGGSELGPEGPYAIVWHGQSLEWYGDEDPAESSHGRYKPKGDAGNVLAKNIPTYAIAQKLLTATEKMSDVGDDGDYGKDYSLVTNSSAPEIVPMSELGKHFYGYESNLDDHHKVMDLKTKMIDISQPEIGYVESTGNAWKSYKNTSKKKIDEITDIEMGKGVTQDDLDTTGARPMGPSEDPSLNVDHRPEIVGKLKNGMKVAVEYGYDAMAVVLYGDQKTLSPVGTIALSKSGKGWISSYSKITTRYQGRGLGLELYKFIIKTLGILLISDLNQTPGSQKVWVKLAQTPGIYVYGRRTSPGQKTQFFHVEPDDLGQLSGELEVYDRSPLRRVPALAGLEQDLKDYWKSIDDMIAKGEISPTKGQQMYDKTRVATAKEIRELSKAGTDTVLIATATKPPAQGFIDLKAPKNEGELSEKAPPGREKQVRALKGKVENPYAVAWASYNKS